jgi:hypothetical protein
MIADEGILRCQLRVGKARRVLGQFGPEIPGCDEPTDEISDDDEIQAFEEEVTTLLYDTKE